MQKFSLHTHTIGYDGKNSIEEMIIEAKKKGWEAIGISNHLVFHENMPLFHPMFFSSFKDGEYIYKKTCEEIRIISQNHNINVFIGFEVDFFQKLSWRNQFEKNIRTLEFDYLIGATHSLSNKTECQIMQLFDYTRPERPNKEFIDSYWKNVKECIKSEYFNFIAHLDLINKFNLDSSEYNDIKLEIVELLANNNTATEINVSNLKTKKLTFPNLSMLNELNSNNIPIIISDDAHSINELGRNFDEASNLLNSINYKNIIKNPNDIITKKIKLH